MYIVDTRPSLNAETFCTLIIQGECGEPTEQIDFTINVDQNAPKITVKKIKVFLFSSTYLLNDLFLGVEISKCAKK